MPPDATTPFSRACLLLQRISGPLGDDRTLDWLMAAGFALFVTTVMTLAVVMPGYPYDLVPYLGAALQDNAPATAHQLAWQMVENSAPSDIYKDLAGANDYRIRQSSDPEAFNSILPLYAVKVGYIQLLQWLGPTLGWVKSAQWVNYAAALSIGLVSLFWMVRTQCLQGAALVASVLLAGNYIDMVGHPSPDTIATAFTLFAAYMWLRSRETLAMALLLMAFFFRPDTIIFAFALLLAMLAFRLRFWRVAVLFVVMLVLSVAIRETAEHPGWWTHFYFSNVEIQNTLENFTPAFSLFDWGKGMARGIFMSFNNFNWPVLLIFLTAVITATIRAGKTFTTKQSAMLFACILAIGGKFLVFPLPDDRLYIPFLLIGTLIALEVLQPRLGWRQQANQP